MNKTNNELINKIYKLKINDNNTVDVNNKKLIIVNDDNICINENINISFDYTRKNDIYNSISNFSFVIWCLTSVIALKF